MNFVIDSFDFNKELIVSKECVESILNTNIAKFGIDETRKRFSSFIKFFGINVFDESADNSQLLKLIADSLEINLVLEDDPIVKSEFVIGYYFDKERHNIINVVMYKMNSYDYADEGIMTDEYDYSDEYQRDDIPDCVLSKISNG